MHDDGFSSTSATAIYQDIAVLATSFDRISYLYCARESNQVSHFLAREAEDQPHVWVEDPPSFII